MDSGLELSLEGVWIVGEGVGTKVGKASERPVGGRVQGAITCMCVCVCVGGGGGGA